MARAASSYRGARRAQAKKRKLKFPWNVADCKIIEAPPVRPNRRDRSDQAEKRRAARAVTMDFTDGVAGISRALIQHALATVFKKKPKRGWAAAIRRAPFREYFADDPKKHQRALLRHPWYRRKIAADALRAALVQRTEKVA